MPRTVGRLTSLTHAIYIGGSLQLPLKYLQRQPKTYISIWPREAPTNRSFPAQTLEHITPTRTTFIKREILNNERDKTPDGSYIDDPRLAKRFFAAYQLLRQNTSIPVPRVISYDYDQDDHLYLEMEVVAGSVQASHAATVCRMPDSYHMMPNSGPCSNCRSIVRENVEAFVHNAVLLHLRNLRSKSTGLNSYVMPPRWVIDTDDRSEWPVKRSSSAEFVFVLHDLVENNILVDAQTLEVRAL